MKYGITQALLKQYRASLDEHNYGLLMAQLRQTYAARKVMYGNKETTK